MAVNLNLAWVFGFSKDINCGVHSLASEDRNALLLVASQTGVIYDYESRTQLIMQGHCNVISCCCVSKDMKWIVTADFGDNSILVLWDSKTGIPVKTFYAPHKNGVKAVDISPDSLFIATIGSIDEGNGSEIALWAWTQEVDTPIVRHPALGDGAHDFIRFDHTSASGLISGGALSITFWSWESLVIDGYSIPLTKFDIGSNIGVFTISTFLVNGQAVTFTSEGYAILWECSSTSTHIQHHKKATKVSALHSPD